MKYLKSVILIAIAMLAFGSCAPVKEYQKAHLNKAGMELNASTTESYEMNVQSYREGAAGANGGKSGGGCGCN